MNETLLDKGRHNLQVVDMCLGSEDDGLVTLLSYHLQQAAELYLKHHLEISGVPYRKTHDIKELLHQFDDSGVSRPYGYDILQQYAAQLTSYEAKPRYVKNYLVERKEVLEISYLLKCIYTKTADHYNVYTMLKTIDSRVTLSGVQEAIMTLNLTDKEILLHMSDILSEALK